MKTETYTVISSNELDELAQKVRPGFNFVADNEANNDTDYSFQVDDGDIQSFNEEGGLSSSWVSVRDVITALVANGDIPKGNILVTVCW